MYEQGLAEAIGFGAAALVLLLAFGSCVAAGLPLAIAALGLGLGIGMSLVTLAAQLTLRRLRRGHRPGGDLRTGAVGRAELRDDRLRVAAETCAVPLGLLLAGPVAGARCDGLTYAAGSAAALRAATCCSYGSTGCRTRLLGRTRGAEQFESAGDVPVGAAPPADVPLGEAAHRGGAAEHQRVVAVGSQGLRLAHQLLGPFGHAAGVARRPLPQMTSSRTSGRSVVRVSSRP